MHESGGGTTLDMHESGGGTALDIQSKHESRYSCKLVSQGRKGRVKGERGRGGEGGYSFL